MKDIDKLIAELRRGNGLKTAKKRDEDIVYSDPIGPTDMPKTIAEIEDELAKRNDFNEYIRQHGQYQSKAGDPIWRDVGEKEFDVGDDKLLDRLRAGMR
jgi:hypothetical protein